MVDGPGRVAETWEGLGEVSRMTALGEEVWVSVSTLSMKHAHDHQLENFSSLS